MNNNNNPSKELPSPANIYSLKDLDKIKKAITAIISQDIKADVTYKINPPRTRIKFMVNTSPGKLPEVSLYVAEDSNAGYSNYTQSLETCSLDKMFKDLKEHVGLKGFSKTDRVDPIALGVDPYGSPLAPLKMPPLKCLMSFNDYTYCVEFIKGIFTEVDVVDHMIFEIMPPAGYGILVISVIMDDDEHKISTVKMTIVVNETVVLQDDCNMASKMIHGIHEHIEIIEDVVKNVSPTDGEQ